MTDKKNQNQTQINLLNLIPVQNVKCEVQEDGLVVLFKPKFSNSLLVKHVLPRMKHPCYKIKLDDIGSFFWLKCDGTRTVQEIAELHKKKFGEKVEPLYERLTQFLASLEKNRFIILKGKELSGC